MSNQQRGHGSMRIDGEWLVCEDGVTRPAIEVRVRGPGGRLQDDYFLIDSVADQTVFSADFSGRLQFPTQQPPPGFSLVGIGGGSGHVLLRATLEFTAADGGVAQITGEFAAFTDPGATDRSILGRD